MATLGCLALPICLKAAANAGPQLEWEFRALLDGREIGSHTFRLSKEETTWRLETEAAFDVKIFFFTAYSYRHRNVELWGPDGLRAMDAYTDANGKIYEVKGRKAGEDFLLSTRDGDTRLQETVKSFAYWNPLILREEFLLNSQTGQFQQVEIREGEPRLATFGDLQVTARPYRIEIPDGSSITVWYAEENNLWVALESETKSGRILTYEPVRLPDQPPQTGAFFAGS